MTAIAVFNSWLCLYPFWLGALGEKSAAGVHARLQQRWWILLQDLQSTYALQGGLPF